MDQCRIQPLERYQRVSRACIGTDVVGKVERRDVGGYVPNKDNPRILASSLTPKYSAASPIAGE